MNRKKRGSKDRYKGQKARKSWAQTGQNGAYVIDLVSGCSAMPWKLFRSIPGSICPASALNKALSWFDRLALFLTSDKPCCAFKYGSGWCLLMVAAANSLLFQVHEDHMHLPAAVLIVAMHTQLMPCLLLRLARAGRQHTRCDQSNAGGAPGQVHQAAGFARSCIC
eukprot:1152880-Pelagomonas_calceolata.AAC.4